MSNYTPEQIEQIRLAFVDFCENNKDISFTLVSKNVGYSVSYISQFYNGKFPVPATLPEIAAKIEDFLNNQSNITEQDAFGTGLMFAFTKAAQAIFKVVDYAQTRGTIGLVTGMPGYGKTITLKEYCKRKKTSILIEVTPVVNQLSLLQDICAELKLPTHFYKGNSDHQTALTKDILFKSICHALMNTHRLLLIDEGENLTVSCLESIRRIQDITHVGIVLCGTARLRSRLKGEKQGLMQLSSRIGIQTEIEKMQLPDVKAILDVNFPEASKFALNYLSLSKNNGRLLQHLIALTIKTLKETGGHITTEIIDQAASSLLT